MGERVYINEVGLRDGLQNQPRLVPVADKVRIFDALRRAGVAEFEATSFVSPKAVPQMADASQLLQAISMRGADLSVLVPNVRGYERARAAGARKVAVVLATTDTMNRRNIGMSTAEALAACLEVTAMARRDDVGVRAYVATAFACPFEGAVAEDVVYALAARLLDAGAGELAIADTIGAGHPEQARRLFGGATRRFGAEHIAAHLHDTRGMGLALAWMALDAGVRRFDASIGGLGGCPFAPGATGNLATEDLVFALAEGGYSTGIDFDGLMQAVRVVEDVLQTRHGGKIMPWWTSRREAPARASNASAGGNATMRMNTQPEGCQQ